MGGLSNDYVEDLMYSISTNPRSFKGVQPCDLFRDIIEKDYHRLRPNDCFIINLSSSNHGGSHFVCLMINSTNKAEYFDSYGLHYSLDSNIKKALEFAKLKTVIFEKPVQDFSSQFCGLYCSKLNFLNDRVSYLQYNISLQLHICSGDKPD